MPAWLQPDQLEQAVAWQRQCWTQARIAKELGVDQSTVSRSLSRVNRRALRRLEKRTASIKAKQVDQLEWILEEAVGAWLHSKTPKSIEKTVRKGDDDGGMEFSETSTHHCDAALLNQARGALADIRRILSLDTPEKKAPGDDRPVADLGGVAGMVVEMVERMSRRTDGGDE